MAIHIRGLHKRPGSDVQQFPSLWFRSLDSHGWVMITISIMVRIRQQFFFLFFISFSVTFITCFLSVAHYFFPSNNTSTGCIVYVGVKFVNKFATVALLCVIFSIIAVYTGIFVNYDGNDNLKWVWWYFHRSCGAFCCEKLSFAFHPSPRIERLNI